MLVKSLTWPVITLLLIGGFHFVEEAIQPGLQNVFTPPVVALVIAAVGVMLGYRTVQNGGNLVQVIIAGAILGLLPVMLDTVGFGILLGRGQAGTLAAFLGFSAAFWGTLIGGGFGLSRGNSAI